MLPAEAIERNRQRAAARKVRSLANKIEGSAKLRAAVKKALKIIKAQPGFKPDA